MKIVAPLTAVFDSSQIREEPYPFFVSSAPTQPGTGGGGTTDPVTTDPVVTDPVVTDPVVTPPPTTNPPPSSGTTFTAAITQAPANDSKVSGTVVIKVGGSGIQNVELLPEFGYTPKYGSFTVNSAGTEATLNWNTTTAPEGARRFRIAAFNVPPGGSGSTEINCGVRNWTVDNIADAPTTGSVDYFGDSTIFGYINSTTTANPTPVQRFINSQTTNGTYTATNLGLSGQGTTRLLAGGYGGAPSLDSRLASSTATVCIFNHMLNDADSGQDLVTVAQYGNNVRSIIGKVRAAGKFVIWEAPNPSTYLVLDAYLTELKAICSSFNVPLIDQHGYLTKYAADNGVAVSTLVPDGAHPTQTAYNLKGDFAALRFKNIIDNANSQGNGYVQGAGTTTTTPPPSTGDGGTQTYPPGTYPAMLGPRASDFTDTPTFFDDFDGTSLNTSRWSVGDWVNGGNLPAGTMRIANGELQQTGNPATMYTGRNSYNYSVISTDPSRTSPGFRQRFGVFQVEARMPVGKGYWPSFWLFDHPGINRPEIDMYECYAGGSWDYTYPGNQPSYSTPPFRPQLGPTNIHPQTHDGNEFRYQATHVSFNMTNGLDLSAAFHTWTLEWDTGFMKFYFDGNLVQTVTNADTLAWMNQFPLYMYLQLGIVYDPSGGPTPEGTPTGFDSAGVHRVKYCAAWQWKKHL